jgi:hypothetical protein
MSLGSGIVFNRTITPGRIEGVPFSVLPKDIAACFGVHPGTFGTMRTQYTNALKAQRLLLEEQQQSPLSNADLKFLQILVAIFGDDILPDVSVPLSLRDGGPTLEAATMAAKTLVDKVGDVINRFAE